MPVCGRNSDSNCTTSKTPKGMCDIYKKQSQCVKYSIRLGSLYICNLRKVLQILRVFPPCLCSGLGSSPGQPCLCWVSAIITSRTSVRLQNATSSSHSCIQRWRTTRCITPSPCTKLVLMLRPPRLPSLWTTPAVTPRFRYTPSHVAHSTDLFDLIKKPFFPLSVSPSDAQASSLHQIL